MHKTGRSTPWRVSWVYAILLLFNSVTSAHAEMGFYDISSTRIPDAVRNVSESVFSIHVPKGEKKQLALGRINSAIAALNPDIPLENMTIAQLQFCKRYGLDPCVYFRGRVSRGSAFVTRTGSELITNHHVFRHVLSQRFIHISQHHPDLDTAAIVQRLQLTPLFFVLKNQHGDIIYAAQQDNAAYLHSSSIYPETYAPGAFGEKKSLLTQSQDVVRIRLPHNIARPIPIAKVSLMFAPIPGSTVYLLSYPSKTTDRMPEFSVPDSTGDRLFVSMGKVLAVREAEGRVNSVIRNPRAFNVLPTIKIYTDADSARGSSGGVYVNDKGEALGVISENSPDESVTPHLMISHGLSIPQIYRVGKPSASR